MSISGIGGSNAWFNINSAASKARTASTEAKTASASLGQEVAAGASGAWSANSVTGASGRAMNGQDANSFGQAMSSLSQALQSGDTAGAQAAFTKMQSLLQSAGVHGHHHHHHGGAKPVSSTDAPVMDGSPTTQGADPFAASFAAIGGALQGGDLAGAQSAFTQLDGLLQDSPNKLTSPPIGANSPANPAGGAIDLTA